MITSAAAAPGCGERNEPLSDKEDRDRTEALTSLAALIAIISFAAIRLARRALPRTVGGIDAIAPAPPRPRLRCFGGWRWRDRNRRRGRRDRRRGWYRKRGQVRCTISIGKRCGGYRHGHRRASGDGFNWTAILRGCATQENQRDRNGEKDSEVHGISPAPMSGTRPANCSLLCDQQSGR